MTRNRRSAVAVLCLTLALAGGTAWWTAGAGAAVQKAAAPPGLQPWGVNYSIHTYSDQNFCLDSTLDGVGATGEMAQCAARDSQHYTFVHTTAGPLIVVDGLGQCLATPPKGEVLNQFTNCTFGGVERFYYNGDTGQIQNSSGKQCLQAAVAAQGAGVFFAKCQVDPPLHTSLQVWLLSH